MVRTLCNFEQYCTIEASSTFFNSDPCPGQVNHLTISYDCAPAGKCSDYFS